MAYLFRKAYNADDGYVNVVFRALEDAINPRRRWSHD